MRLRSYIAVVMRERGDPLSRWLDAKRQPTIASRIRLKFPAPSRNPLAYSLLVTWSAVWVSITRSDEPPIMRRCPFPDQVIVASNGLVFEFTFKTRYCMHIQRKYTRSKLDNWRHLKRVKFSLSVYSEWMHNLICNFHEKGTSYYTRFL